MDQPKHYRRHAYEYRDPDGSIRSIELKPGDYGDESERCVTLYVDDEPTGVMIHANGIPALRDAIDSYLSEKEEA